MFTRFLSYCNLTKLNENDKVLVIYYSFFWIFLLYLFIFYFTIEKIVLKNFIVHENTFEIENHWNVAHAAMSNDWIRLINNTLISSCCLIESEKRIVNVNKLCIHFSPPDPKLNSISISELRFTNHRVGFHPLPSPPPLLAQEGG